MTIATNTNLPPRVFLLTKALEEILPKHPRIKPIAHYIPSDRMEQPHDYNPKGWWTFQPSRTGDNESIITNRSIDPGYRFTAFCIDPNRALGAIEIITEVLLTMDWKSVCIGNSDVQQYVTSVWRSSVNLPVVYRPKVQANSAVAMIGFALKRDS